MVVDDEDGDHECSSAWQGEGDPGATVCRRDLDGAADLVGTVAHAAQPDTTIHSRATVPVVLDLEHEILVRDSGCDPTAGRGRVPDHVGDRFLGDPVCRHLHGGRQGGLLLGQVELEAQAGGHGELATELSDCTEQAQLVDGRRTEALDDASHLGHRLADAATKG